MKNARKSEKLIQHQQGIKKNREPDSNLEKEMLYAFQASGWQCQMCMDWLHLPSIKYRPDIELRDGGSVRGYVECCNFRLMNPSRLERTQQIVEYCKPELFILTDGAFFEVYFDGEYKGTMSVPIDCYSYHKMREKMEKDRIEVTDDKDN